MYRHEQCPETCLECKIAPVVDVEVCQQSANAEPLDDCKSNSSVSGLFQPEELGSLT